MKQILYHTPDGVRDIYDNECSRKHALERNLCSVMNSYGYRDIETPTFEYFDVFSNEIGTIPSKDLYKFFDREGHTLVLRPDFTPSIARAASKYFDPACGPVRLCYHGSTFVNHSSLQGRLKETTQIGAELIGDGSAEADAEIIAMTVSTMRRAGLRDFQITVGNAQFLDTLMAEAGLDEEAVAELRELIRNKNGFGVRNLLGSLDMDERIREVLGNVTRLFGDEKMLDKAEEAVKGLGAEKAVKRLKEVHDILKIYELDRYITYDLGMTSGYMYYTGIIFRGFTYGTGDAVVKGGRYDNLLEHFGSKRAATGFVVMVDELMNALSRQKIDILTDEGTYLILYSSEERSKAIRKAVDYRNQGRKAELRLIPEGEEVPSDQKLMADGIYASVIRIGVK